MRNNQLDTLGITALYDLSQTQAASLLEQFDWPWDVLPHIREWILAYGKQLDRAAYDRPAPDVWIARSARVAPSSRIEGPCVIGERTELRHGAFIRGAVLVGDDCVVGNSTELKNAILFDRVQVPHYNYIGDSILGAGAHFGAGALTSNVRSDKQPVVVRAGRYDKQGSDVPTGLLKVGAFVGDGCELGCHAVLNPGTVLGKWVRVYPLTLVRGCIPEKHMIKQDGTLAAIREETT